MSIDHEEMVYSHLTGKYKHYCTDWDSMAIDETYPEFEFCTCYPKAVYEETEHLRIMNDKNYNIGCGDNSPNLL